MQPLNIEYHGAGPPLVLLHGWSMNSAIWQSLIPLLSRRWQLICIDLPGHGRSVAEANDKDSAFADWLAALLAAAPPQAHWLGWSLGGLFAMAIAAQAPERVQGLHLVASTPRFVAADGWSQAMPLSTLQQFAGQLNNDAAAAQRRFMQLQTLGLNSARQLSRTLQQLQALGGIPTSTGLTLGMQFLQEVDLRDVLQNILCSIQFVFGEHDKLVPAAVAEDLHQLNNSIRSTIIEGGSHVPFLSHRQEFLSALNI